MSIKFAGTENSYLSILPLAAYANDNGLTINCLEESSDMRASLKFLVPKKVYLFLECYPFFL
jgi:hypothetical protein